MSHALFERILSGSGAEVVFATSAVEALAQVNAEPCDLAIVSLNLPDLDGLELLRRICESGLARKVVVLQDRDDPCTAYLLDRLPIKAVVNPLRCDERRLRNVLARVLCGEIIKRPRKAAATNTASDVFSRLTPREFEVLTLIGGGSSVAEAAARLGVSENTVQTHRHRVAIKLRLKSRQDLIWKAVVCGAVRITSTGQLLPGLSCLRAFDTNRKRRQAREVSFA